MHACEAVFVPYPPMEWGFFEGVDNCPFFFGFIKLVLNSFISNFAPAN